MTINVPGEAREQTDEEKLWSYATARERLLRALKITHHEQLYEPHYSVTVGTLHMGVYPTKTLAEDVQALLADELARTVSQRIPLEKAIPDPPNLRKGPCPVCGGTNLIDASRSIDCNDCGHSW